MASNYIKIESVSGGVKNRVKQNLNVTTINNTPLLTNIRYDTVNNYIEIEPLEPYNRDESYLLHVSNNVESKRGQKLANDITIQFKL